MLDPTLELRRASEAIGALGARAFFINRRAASRALLGHLKGRLALLFVRDHLDDLGDDVPGPLDADRIAFSQVFAFDLLAVVKGGSGYCYTAHDNRTEGRDRRQHPGDPEPVGHAGRGASESRCCPNNIGSRSRSGMVSSGRW